MPPNHNKKCSTRVRFGETSSNANPLSTSIPASLAASLNVSTRLTICPISATIDNIVGKVFSKSLIASHQQRHGAKKGARLRFH